MKWRSSLLFASILLFSVVLPYAGSTQNTSLISSFGKIQISAYLSAQGAGKLRIARIYPGGGSVLSVIEDTMGTIEKKRAIMDYVVNRLHANALMIHWRRQNVSWDTEDQLESPYNSGQLNPKYIVHLDQWVNLSKQYNVYMIFAEWFSPMNATSNGYWTGFNDSDFQQHWQSFYYVLAKHFAGNTTIAGFSPGEDVVYDDTWPYTDSGNEWFNSLWNQKMTNLSIAVHQADPNFNFIAETTIDWSGGYYTLGSKAMYPNAWQPLPDTNPHVLYKVQWNPSNSIKNSASNNYYPFDGGIVNGGANWIKETGLPLTIALELKPDFVWDSVAYQWEKDILPALRNAGIGGTFGIFENESADDIYSMANAMFYANGTEKPWVSIYSNWASSQTP